MLELWAWVWQECLLSGPGVWQWLCVFQKCSMDVEWVCVLVLLTKLVMTS